LLSGAKRKAEESSTEGGSSDAAMLTSPRVSPAKSRARRGEEKKKEEEEASNRVSPPLQDVEMQDPPRNEGAAHVVVETYEVPTIEVVRTAEIPAIKTERTQAEPSEGAKTPAVKEEDKEDESLGSHLVECAKLTHEWVQVILLPLFVYEAGLFLQVFCCNAKLFSRLWWSCRSRPPRSEPKGAPPSVGWRISRPGWPSWRRRAASWRPGRWRSRKLFARRSTVRSRIDVYRVFFALFCF